MDLVRQQWHLGGGSEKMVISVLATTRQASVLFGCFSVTVVLSLVVLYCPSSTSTSWSISRSPNLFCVSVIISQSSQSPLLWSLTSCTDTAPLFPSIHQRFNRRSQWPLTPKTPLFLICKLGTSSTSSRWSTRRGRRPPLALPHSRVAINWWMPLWIGLKSQFNWWLILAFHWSSRCSTSWNNQVSFEFVLNYLSVLEILVTWNPTTGLV